MVVCSNARTIPLTILSGFLGAGKTTLLRNILLNSHGKHILVVQNEFSKAMGIEAPLISDNEGNSFPDFYELPNGCMCCSVRESLLATVEAALQLRPNYFDHIVFESSGVANPEELVRVFWTDTELCSKVELDGVVTLVDAKNIRRYVMRLPESEVVPFLDEISAAEAAHTAETSTRIYLKTSESRATGASPGDESLGRIVQDLLEAPHAAAHASDSGTVPSTSLDRAGRVVEVLSLEAAKQIACASVILINKVDLLTGGIESGSTVDSSCNALVDAITHEIIRPINPDAAVFSCVRGDVELSKILGIGAFRDLTLNSTGAAVGQQTDTAYDAGLAKFLTGYGANASDQHRPVQCGTGLVHQRHRNHGNPVRSIFIEGTIPCELVTQAAEYDAQNSKRSKCYYEFCIATEDAHTTSACRPPTVAGWNQIFGQLLWEDSGGPIYRCKGLFLASVAHSNVLTLCAVQGVGPVFEITEIEGRQKLAAVHQLLQSGAVRKMASESQSNNEEPPRDSLMQHDTRGFVGKNRAAFFTNRFLFVGLELDETLLRRTVLAPRPG